jgi:hypothetical protein
LRHPKILLDKFWRLPKAAEELAARPDGRAVDPQHGVGSQKEEKEKEKCYCGQSLKDHTDCTVHFFQPRGYSPTIIHGQSRKTARPRNALRIAWAMSRHPSHNLPPPCQKKKNWLVVPTQRDQPFRAHGTGTILAPMRTKSGQGNMLKPLS